VATKVLAVDDDLQLSDRDLERIASLVYERSGITLHAGKRALIVARLQKRLRALGLASFGEYLAHVERDASGDEIVLLLDAIATNHTYFFREEPHFTWLRQFLADRKPGAPLRIWSAACSTGEEPYSIAITVATHAPALDLHLVASDLSTKALRAAHEGVYKLASVEGLPRDVLQKYFEKGLGAQAGLARVAADVRRRVAFRRLNLLEIGDLGERFDVIFCRNVMIYFDRTIQQRVVSMLERHLAPSGFLCISHSESLNGLNHRLRWIAPAIYQWVSA
jgi:chemotaxis protein methyltransferase CheR